MRFETTEVKNTVEILAADDFTAIPIKVVSASGATTTLVMAGTPLKEDGTSTTGTGAVGILLYDVDTARDPNAAVVVAGVIDAKKAQSHSGVTYADALYTALPAITFRENIGVADDT